MELLRVNGILVPHSEVLAVSKKKKMKLQSGIYFGYIMILIVPIIFLVATTIAYIKLKRISKYQNVKEKIGGIGASLGIGLVVTSLIISAFLIVTTGFKIM